MEKPNQKKRPLGLWLVVIAYSLFVALFVALQISLRIDEKYAHYYSHMTLLDYLTQFYPIIVIAVGVLGLVLQKRWALYLFLGLMLLRVYQAMLTVDLPYGELSALTWWLGWLSPTLLLLPALLYSIRAVRKGVLR